jgi:hypothetical protein
MRGRESVSIILSFFSRKDCATGAEIARELGSSIVQHIVDEENVLLRLFVDVLGREGADDAIKVFQQHRTIHKLTDVIARRATASLEGLASTPSELDKLVRSHFGLEEERIFPWALDIERCGRSIRKLILASSYSWRRSDPASRSANHRLLGCTWSTLTGVPVFGSIQRNGSFQSSVSSILTK